MLGIVGMWRQGIGADPYFALCIGEVMIRVGQRHLAWSAYERSFRLSKDFSPDPATQQFLRDHCKKRQEKIEKSLEKTNSGQTQELRARFESELAAGMEYQAAYQKYEADRIARGVPLTDEHFYDEFHATRQPIASQSGPEEWYTYEKRDETFRVPERPPGNPWGWGILGSGIAAMMMATLLLIVTRLYQMGREQH
jgi:hypothetical protein